MSPRHQVTHKPLGSIDEGDGDETGEGTDGTEGMPITRSFLDLLGSHDFFRTRKVGVDAMAFPCVCAIAAVRLVTVAGSTFSVPIGWINQVEEVVRKFAAGPFVALEVRCFQCCLVLVVWVVMCLCCAVMCYAVPCCAVRCTFPDCLQFYTHPHARQPR